MSSTLNFDLRQAPPALFNGARWPVLTMLIVHSNKRNRCWPTMETIAAKVGKALPTVTAAKKWLLDHGAIELVPYDKRVDEEKDLAPRRHVYQLTGKIKIEDKPLAYLYDNDTDNGEVQNDTTLNNSEIETSPTEISASKISIDKTLTNSNSKSKSRKRKKLNSLANVASAPSQVVPASAPIGQDVPKLPEPPKGFKWVTSADSSTVLAHLRKNKNKLGCLCKTSIKGSNDYQIGIGPRQPCLVCLKATEPKPKATKEPLPWSALTKAMHEATPEDIRPITCHYAKNDVPAHALFDAGFTPERITAFVIDNYPTYREWAEQHKKPMIMSMQHVSQFIKAWEATKGKQAAPVQVVDLPGASDEETEAYLERLSIKPEREVEDNYWPSAREQLELQLGKSTFRTWVEHLRLVALDKGPPAVYTFKAPNQYVKDWVERHLAHSLTKTLAALRKCEVKVEIVIAAAVEVTVAGRGA